MDTTCNCVPQGVGSATALGNKHKDHKNVILVETMSGNKEGVTCRKIAGANCACRTYDMVDHPLLVDSKGLIQGNMLKNFPLTIADIEAAECKPMRDQA